MKRLLCVLSNVNAGGAETFLMKMFRAVDRSQYCFDFCVNLEGKNYYEDEINQLGGKVFKIPSKSEDRTQFKKQLSEIIRREGYESVLRITSNSFGFMDLMVAKKAGAKNCCVRSSNSSDGNSWKVKIAHKLGRLLYGKFIDVKIAPSELAAEYTFGKKSYRNGEVNILHNAVDLSVFKFDEEWRKQVRSEFGIKNQTLVVGHVGRFNLQKNHEFLIEVFNEINKRNPESILMLVGIGDLEGKIKEKVLSLGLQDKVVFTGLRSDVPKMLCAMDVFVFPSFYEGMPNTVIEAQATGLPCIIANTITKEANITGLVEYLSLSDSAEQWAEKTLSKSSNERKNTYDDFVENGYDIECEVKRFIGLVFGE